MLSGALLILLSASLPTSQSDPHDLPVKVDVEHDHVSLAGDKLAAIIGELDGDATPGAGIGKVLDTLAERLERTTCHRQAPINAASNSSVVICNAPDVEAIFHDYADLRRATTPAEQERRGRRLLDAYVTLFRDAPDVALTRPSEDAAADGLLHVLFPFEAWDEKLDIPRHQVHFPFVPVCNLIVAHAARCPGADQLRGQIGKAGDESEQRLFCIKEFSRRKLELSDGCSE